MNIEIRNETPNDISAIHKLTIAAFLEAEHTDHTEQFIVDALRKAGALSVSLVAEKGNEIIGHIAVSPIVISGGIDDWYGLGPIAVSPALQGLGVGSRLVKQAMTDLKQQNAGGCVLLGDPNYYGRFGFKQVEGLNLPGMPPEYFMALSFNNEFVKGEVSYHKAFLVRG